MSPISVSISSRRAFKIGRDPADPERLILASIKNNIVRRPDSLAFRLVAGRANPDVAVLKWETVSLLTAQNLVSTEPGSRAVDEAKQWLCRELSEGPKPAIEMYELAEAAGIARRTLKRALRQVGDARKIGFGTEGQWVWSLGEESPKKS